MNLAILNCRAEHGMEAPVVTIEVVLSGGLPAFTIVDMAATAVRESKDRVHGALMSSGFELPQQRITISLGPADMRKTGGRYELAIAAAGGHNLLFVGPPGTGKSMLARRLPGILPSMTEVEALEIAAIDSVLGKPLAVAGRRRRPYRAPHHTASAAALVGGGPGPRPGEVSRAHSGVLFLDELPAFNRNVLEVLREPMETGVITISRAGRQADYPAKFQLIAAMNPCPCGYLGDRQADCRCSGGRIANYKGKISGPLLDRIDLHVEVMRPATSVLRSDNSDAETSATVAARIRSAWCLQTERSGVSNARLDGEKLAEVCDVGDRC